MNVFKELKKTINKKEFITVIGQLLFISISASLLLGAIHALLISQYNLSLTWMMMFLFGFLMVKRLRGYYYDFHIIYAIAGVVSVILTYYLMMGMAFLMMFAVRDALSAEIIKEVMNPGFHYQFLNPFNPRFFKVNNLIDVAFFIFVNIYVFRSIK